MVQKEEPISIALVWAQFAAYHVDRCEAVARRLDGRVRLTSIEVATTSADYAWEPSRAPSGIGKVTLFPGMSYEAVPPARKLRALWDALRLHEWVFLGLSYAEPWVVILTWALRLRGVKVVLFSESKADDRPRRYLAEFAKRIALSCYHGAIVGAARHVNYFRSLGFRRRPVLPGYDCVGIDRIRQMAGGTTDHTTESFTGRPFVFVGRFVAKKNLQQLLEGFAAYVGQAGPAAHRLVLAGSGEEEEQVRNQVSTLGIGPLVDMPGFLAAPAVAELLSRSLALVLVSREEQWGLVVNEALAVGLPVIVSPQVGSRDALVRDSENGFVVDTSDSASLPRAMHQVAGSEEAWRAFSVASLDRAWLGDTERLADAVEIMLGLAGTATEERMRDFAREALVQFAGTTH